jgi:signal peptidase I
MSAVAHDNSDKNMEKLSIPPGEISRVTLSQAISLRLQVSGQSMYPLIQPGDTILIEAANADNLTPGDIALYYLPSGIFLIHRVIKKNSSGSLLTNGDSLRQPDEPIAGEQVFGRVVEIERNGRAINLTGTLNGINARLVTFLARHRLPLQIHMKQALGRLQWFLGGKIKA